MFLSLEELQKLIIVVLTAMCCYLVAVRDLLSWLWKLGNSIFSFDPIKGASKQVLIWPILGVPLDWIFFFALNRVFNFVVTSNPKQDLYPPPNVDETACLYVDLDCVLTQINTNLILS